MLKEIIDEIKQAEAHAEEIVENASLRAKEIRQQGEKESAAIVIAANNEAAELLSSLEQETELAAKGEEDLVLEKGKKQAAAVRQSAEGRVTEAAEKVGDCVFEKYGVTAL